MDEQLRDLATAIGAAMGAALIAGIASGLQKAQRHLSISRGDVDLRFGPDFHTSIRELRRSTSASRVVVLYAHRDKEQRWHSTTIASNLPDEDANPSTYWSERVVTDEYAAMLQRLIKAGSLSLVTRDIKSTNPELWVIYEALRL
jgi:hypothetical protein